MFAAVCTDVVVLWLWSVRTVNAVRSTQLHCGSHLHVRCYWLQFIPPQWNHGERARHCTKVHRLCLRSVILALTHSDNMHNSVSVGGDVSVKQILCWIIRPVWVSGPRVCYHCRISPPRFLAECRKRPLNQGSFVLLFLGCLLCLICI